MKSFKSLLLASAPAFLAAALVLLPGAVRADAKGGATRQVSLSRPIVTTVATSPESVPAAMNCDTCTDSKTVVAEKTFKGSQPVVQRVVTTHGCSSCTTKLVSVGHGKMATTKPVHACDIGPKACALE